MPERKEARNPFTDDMRCWCAPVARLRAFSCEVYHPPFPDEGEPSPANAHARLARPFAPIEERAPEGLFPWGRQAAQRVALKRRRPPARHGACPLCALASEPSGCRSRLGSPDHAQADDPPRANGCASRVMPPANPPPGAGPLAARTTTTSPSRQGEGRRGRSYCSPRFPRRACSRSSETNRALKFPTPKPREPWRSMTS